MGEILYTDTVNYKELSRDEIIALGSCAFFQIYESDRLGRWHSPKGDTHDQFSRIIT